MDTRIDRLMIWTSLSILVFSELLENRHMIIMKMILVLFMLLTVGCSLFLPSHPQRDELRAAYENFKQVSQQADLTLDKSKLSQVATGDMLDALLQSVEQGEANALLSSSEIMTRNFQVLSYSDNTATVRAGETARYFSQNKQTGERDYYSENSFKIEIVMIKENDLWKVSSISTTFYDE